MRQAELSTLKRGLMSLLLPLSLLAGCQDRSGAARSGAGSWPPPLGASLAPRFDSEEASFQLTTVAEGLDHPWSMAFLPNGEILVTERPGRLRLLRAGKLLPEPLGGVPEVLARGQGGLLDIALHKDFAKNGLVYLSYAKPGPEGGTTAIMRGRLGPTGLEDGEEIFVAKAWGSTGHHFGGRMVFDRSGHLYLTVGDRGRMEQAQDPSNHNGTTLRLRDDGSVPKDNPFVGQAGYLPEIYSYGHRNAQGMTVHTETGAIWQNEHGPKGGDEINIIKAGANYGWPKVTYGIDYNGAVLSERTEMEGVESPVLQWTPSIAPSGMVVYTGDAFPQWKGNVFSGALVLTHLRRVAFQGGKPVHEEKLLADLGERIRYVTQGPDGLLYLLTDARNGRMLRLDPSKSSN